jgi:hypothetical protein
MRKFLFILVGSAIVIGIGAAALSAAQEETDIGSAMMKLESGRLPAAPFPHRLHQKTLDECNACHSMFPQKRGAIKELQAQGKLNKQEVMNKNCIACHKERKKAGEPSGPVSCTDCHAR